MWHLQYSGWQDHGCPEDVGQYLAFCEEMGALRRHTVSEVSAGVNTNTPVLVHCSAGVGRTGTFIGLYKLVNDYNDDTVESNIESLTNSMSAIPQVDKLDPFETVVTMRRQRNKMVQKPMQYNYMFRCLADYVAETTSDYV